MKKLILAAASARARVFENVTPPPAVPHFGMAVSSDRRCRSGDMELMIEALMTYAIAQAVKS